MNYLLKEKHAFFTEEELEALVKALARGQQRFSARDMQTVIHWATEVCIGKTIVEMALEGTSVLVVKNGHVIWGPTGKEYRPFWQPLSPAMEFLSLLWETKCRAVPYSHRMANHGMRQALYLAISMGLRFEREDFTWLATQAPFRFWDWCGTENAQNHGEHFYTKACEVGYMSACHSFEQWKGRKPFLVHGQRLYVGSALQWDGYTTVVTSFNDSQQQLVACVSSATGARFSPNRHGTTISPLGAASPTHRYVLSHADLRAAQRQEK